MYELTKKELKSFFVSISGYVILVFFLIANGMFLWIVPGGYNILDSGMADLHPFFDLAPFLYLFLVPALCMKLFAEERRTGTLELLFTRPVAVWRIVMAKYLAGFFLVLFSILPTLIYPISLWFLAQPIGHIDIAGIIGSYIGLLFLSGIYVAVGIWTSALTVNQVVAFLYALTITFLLYIGLDFIADMPIFSDIQGYIQFPGMNNHYEPMSRGVIRFSDVIYFLSFIFLFLWLTVCYFQTTRIKKIYIIVGIIGLNLLATKIYWQFDITEDKKYTLSNHTKELLQTVDSPISVDIYLAGKLPPGMQKIQYSLTRMLEEFRRISGNNFRYNLFDPSEVTDPSEKKEMVKYLAERGVLPVNLNRRSDDETLSQQIIFPGALLYDQQTEVSINLLQNTPGQNAEQNINRSIEALEYELTKAVRLLTRTELKSIGFLTGHGELSYPEVMDMAKTLSHYYQVDFVSPDSLAIDLLRYKVLVIAAPTTNFTERDKFIIDQYAMNGGHILWCVDEVQVDHEALKSQETVTAIYRPLNIEDMLFRYGVRINPDLLLDGNSVLIPVVVGMNGTTPEFRPGSWYYSPLLLPHRHHPITVGTQPVRVDYANSIDTIGGNDGLRKNILLATSQYTAVMKTPCPVTLAITEEKMTSEKFNREYIPVAVAVEGTFKSLFQFRHIEGVVNIPFKRECEYGKMIFIADGDIIRNKVRGVGANEITLPLGYDEYNNQMYGNRDFLLNCINWLSDDEGWMTLRGRHISMYLLNKTYLKAERKKWGWINLLLPLALVGILGGCIKITRRNS